MSQKSALKNRPERRPPRDNKTEETVVETPLSEEDSSGTDQFLDNIKPYLGTIGLVVVAVVLAMIALAVYRSANFQTEAIRWTELNQAASLGVTTGNISELTRVAEENADNSAGLFASLYAARIQLRNGAAQLGEDREAGLELIEQAKRNLVAVVESKDKLKTPLLSQKALFYLGYANESLGDFEAAKSNYDQLIESFPESPMRADAERGLKRCTPEFASLYKAFEKYEADVIGDAPGPSLTDPDRPSSAINEFDGVDLPTGQNAPGDKQDAGQESGDAEKEGEMKSGEGDQPAAPPAETANADSKAAESSDPEKAESAEAAKPTEGEGEAKPKQQPPAEGNQGGSETEKPASNEEKAEGGAPEGETSESGTQESGESTGDPGVGESESEGGQ